MSRTAKQRVVNQVQHIHTYTLHGTQSIDTAQINHVQCIYDSARLVLTCTTANIQRITRNLYINYYYHVVNTQKHQLKAIGLTFRGID